MGKNEENLNDIEFENLEEMVQENSIDKDQYIAKLNDDLQEQRKKTDEYFDHLKRSMAEFDNFKKRMSKEKDTMYYTITADIISDLLPIMDNFENAISTETKDKSFKEGMEMIYTQLKDTFKKLGLEEIEALGIEFNPNLHEAVMHVDDDSKGEKEIIEVLRKGYKIGEKVVRHSMVKVAN